MFNRITVGRTTFRSHEFVLPLPRSSFVAETWRQRYPFPLNHSPSSTIECAIARGLSRASPSASCAP